ncbi:MAG: excinuclease ABC subunit UvrC [Alphaproteobacteria bacterium]
MDADRTAKPGKRRGAETRPAARGRTVLADAVRTLSGAPGVYRMLDARGGALYVGKAKNLKRRVTSYTQFAKLPLRLKRMVAETHQLEVVTTRTEAEALLLESNLIKRLKPRYNVLLRDDKSFPSILITRHDWPQLTKHRGATTVPGDYFGPFASAGAVNETLAALERAFLLRSCPDTVFENRTRPCLLYQIRRCSGPCVGRISRDDYAALVREAVDFLSGRSADIQHRLATRMQESSDALDFERASVYRDRIRALTQVQSRQDINLPRIGDVDVIGAHRAAGHTCIQVFFFRAGRNYGNRAYFPRHDPDLPVQEVVAAFLGQFYANKEPPPAIFLSHRPTEIKLIEEALSTLRGQRVHLMVPSRGPKHRLIENAVTNAAEALARRMAESASQRALLEGVADVFGLEAPPERIEVYDNSHVSGKNAVGAMIVAGPEGFMKAAYRKFTIRTVGPAQKGARPAGLRRAAEGTAGPAPGVESQPRPGDDYAMIREVLTRRFARALREDPERANGSWPDLVLIDGGPGHLAVTEKVLADLGVSGVPVAAIAKGPERNAGRERFHVSGRAPFRLEPQDPVLYFLERLRDEAHRFAIGAHRAKRSKDIARSPLDEVPGIGAKRKRALLHHFGSARNVAAAALEDLELVDGISRTVAKKIYDHFHDGR